MFSGYYRDPGRTAEVLKSSGSILTGDVGRIDEAGYLYITDRAKDMIITGGMNVYPAEIEAVLTAMPGISEVAVIGMPDDRWGEAVTAVIVRRAGASISEEDVVEFARSHMASYKKPHRVAFIDALPRNTGMKVQKRVLRDQFGGGS